MTEALIFSFPPAQPEEIQFVGRVNHMPLGQKRDVIEPIQGLKITHEGYDGSYDVHAQSLKSCGSPSATTWVTEATVEEGASCLFAAGGKEFLIYHKK